MGRVFFIMLLMGFSYLTHAQSKVDSNFHLYLLIGQSNMTGRGKIDEQSKIKNTRILMLDSLNNWVVAKDPVHFDKPKSVGVGPAIAFATQMLQNEKDVRIGLIPCAWGGSPIKAWQPGAKYFNAHPYDDAIKRTRLAMKQGVLKGILWHQGESDNDSVRSKKYLNELKLLVQRLRADLNQPELPFVAGEIGYFNKVDFVNAAINKLPAEAPNTAVVSAKGLTDMGDRLHFDATSARELGKRYAIAMQHLQSTETMASARKNNPPVVLLCFDDAELSHYTNVAPLLKQYGFGATFLVCEMARKPEDSVYYMNWQQITALSRMGFEIGNHTGHHKNMTKLSVDEKVAEIKYIEDKCQMFDIPKPVSFAYPGNRHDSASLVVLKTMGYKYARTGGSRLYDPKVDAPLAIPSFTMGSSEKLSARTWYALKQLQPGLILAFTIHGVPDIAHPDYSTSEKEFVAFLDFMKKNQFKVIAMKDLANLGLK